MPKKELILEPDLPCSAFLLHKSINKLAGIFRKGLTVKTATGLEGTLSSMIKGLRSAISLFFLSLYILFQLATSLLLLNKSVISVTFTPPCGKSKTNSR